MSSRTGPRASGTDGSDFDHREKIASHYKDSVKWKLKLKLNLCLHLLLVVLGALWTGLSYLNFLVRIYVEQDRDELLIDNKKLVCYNIHTVYLLGACGLSLMSKIIWLGQSKITRMIQYRTQDWQVIWLCTLIPVVFGLSSLPKNKYKLMYIYVIGSFAFGFGPVIYGASKYVNTVLGDLQENKADSLGLRGLSIKLAVIALVVQMQIIGVYYAVRLINAWKLKGEKKSS